METAKSTECKMFGEGASAREFEQVEKIEYLATVTSRRLREAIECNLREAIECNESNNDLLG